MKLLAFPDLGARGISFSRQHLWRLVKMGRFPAPIRLGTNTNRWVAGEIDRWLEEQIARRDAETARQNAERGERNANDIE